MRGSPGFFPRTSIPGWSKTRRRALFSAMASAETDGLRTFQREARTIFPAEAVTNAPAGD
jgi:hypothetical protein